MIITKGSYSLTVCTSKKYRKKNCRKRLLFENSHSINKITLIRINFPTLALDFVITVRITIYKCRQTIAEVQFSCRVNQDTRQTRERKIYCQAKNVKMQTTAFRNKQSLVAWGENVVESGLERFFRYFLFFFFFCLKYLTLSNYNAFLSDLA